MSNLTQKQENFCLKYIETGNASESYRHAYDAEKMKDETIVVKASELLKNGKITVRLEELRKPIIEKHNVTVDSLMKELEQARALALIPNENGSAQPSAAVSATMGKAKLAGLLVDKKDVNLNAHLETAVAPEMSREEWLKVHGVKVGK